MRPKTIVSLSPALNKDLRLPPTIYNLAIERARHANPPENREIISVSRN